MCSCSSTGSRGCGWSHGWLGCRRTLGRRRRGCRGRACRCHRLPVDRSRWYLAAGNAQLDVCRLAGHPPAELLGLHLEPAAILGLAKHGQHILSVDSSHPRIGGPWSGAYIELGHQHRGCRGTVLGLHRGRRCGPHDGGHHGGNHERKQHEPNWRKQFTSHHTRSSFVKAGEAQKALRISIIAPRAWE